MTHVRTVALTLLVALELASCKRVFTSRGRGAPTTAPSTPATSSSAGIPFGPTIPVTAAEAKSVRGTPLRAGSVSLGAPVVSGGDFYVDGGSVAPARLFVTDVPANLARRARTRMLSRTDGKTIATFFTDEDFRFSERAGVAVVHAAARGPAELLDLDDGSLHAPELVSKGGAALVEPLYVLDAKSPRVWVAAREPGAGADGGVAWWAGSFEGARTAKVTLPVGLEHEPYDGKWDATIDAVSWEPRGGFSIPLGAKGASGPCTRRRVDAHDGSVCTGAGLLADGPEHADFLAGDLAVFYGVPDDVLVDTRLRVTRPLHAPIADWRAESCRVGATYASPPRVLEVCQRRSAATTATLWSPARTVTWTEPLFGTRGFTLEGLQREPIAHLADTEGRGAERRTRLFVDLERQRVLHTPDVEPLRAVFGSARPALAFVRDGAALELDCVDVDGGELVLLATYRDCPGFLKEEDRAGARVLVACEVQPNPSLFAFRHVWSELIDLDRGVRYRLPVRGELLLDDGTLVASDRMHDGAEAVFAAHRVYLPALAPPLGP